MTTTFARFGFATATAVALLAVWSVGGCRPTPRGPAPHGAPVGESSDYIRELEGRAAASPSDFGVQKSVGLALMWITLAGDRARRDRAEHYLEAAFALDSSDDELNRSLGRFYNMRSVDGDYSKADIQVRVYAGLLGGKPVADMGTSEFVAHSFAKMGEALACFNRGQRVRALRTVRELERVLDRRTREDPDDIEVRALAGNFAFFFAGNIPFGKRRRVETAVRHFEVVRMRWGELRRGARDPVHCPNTYENFMFELAEGYLVLRDRAAARALYEELSHPRSPITRPKQLVAHVSRERLANLESYVGDLDLMPPWPSDVDNCVVCHSHTVDVSFRSLHTVAPLPVLPAR